MTVATARPEGTSKGRTGTEDEEAHKTGSVLGLPITACVMAAYDTADGERDSSQMLSSLRGLQSPPILSTGVS